ncbi:MAG: D-alanyl-D-alanine carboxypeptidase, partial [Alphaproteobacteria bacterium HGW-Alphaproteobacteria-6]
MVLVAVPMASRAAPYADYVIDARSGQVLHQTNAETRLHPASLTKMMTLYIAFEAIERGEISLDSKVTVSKKAASEPPSKLGLRAGQTIALRYLIRAAAVKSANDAATAIGEAIEGSEAAFARRMTRTAKALGMTRTTFANANGLTAKGHLSTARDMAILGRRVFYDYPQYYNLFSRRTADAGIAQVNSTNRRFLDSYEGADGIKTGFTNPAGFNLVGSAQRGEKRIIAAVFGGTSTAQRNARMAELLDLGFAKAPRRATVQKPVLPVYVPEAAGADLLAEAGDGAEAGGAGKTLRLIRAVTKSPRPQMRPTALVAVVPDAAPAEVAAGDEARMLAMLDGIASAVAEAQGVAAEDTTGAEPQAIAEAVG